MKFSTIITVLVIPIAMLAYGCSEKAQGMGKKGFLQAQGTKLYLNGKEFREVSFNKYDMFFQFVLEDIEQWRGLPAGRVKAELGELQEHGFRIIRVICSPFYSTWYKQAFFDDDPKAQFAKRKRFFKRFDEMLDMCDRHNIILIASLAWNITNFADLGHHSLHEGITNPDSPGRKKSVEYIKAVVERYKDRKTIAMWELGNEWNLSADLQFEKGIITGPPADDTRYCIAPVVRDKRNNITSDELANVCREIALLIKSIDQNHLITSGHSHPRPSAMHLYRAAKAGKPVDWTLDSERETIEYIKLIHPEPIDVVSVHFYEDPDKTYGKELEIGKRLKIFKTAADEMNKPLLLGETGLLWTMKNVKGYLAPEAVKHEEKLLNIVVENEIPLTLCWSYSTDSVKLRDKITQWNMRYGQSADILKVIENANRRIKP